jgi:hypothetical protein
MNLIPKATGAAMHRKRMKPPPPNALLRKIMDAAMHHGKAKRERKQETKVSWWLVGSLPEQRNEFITAANARANERGWSGVNPYHRPRVA